MRTVQYVVTDPQGIHARPAGMLVKLAASFPCDITITKDNNTVDAKRIMAVMSLGIKKNQQIILTANGEQEEQAIEKMEQFLNENL